MAELMLLGFPDGHKGKKSFLNLQQAYVLINPPEKRKFCKLKMHRLFLTYEHPRLAALSPGEHQLSSVMIAYPMGAVGLSCWLESQKRTVPIPVPAEDRNSKFSSCLNACHFCSTVKSEQSSVEPL